MRDAKPLACKMPWNHGMRPLALILHHRFSPDHTNLPLRAIYILMYSEKCKLWSLKMHSKTFFVLFLFFAGLHLTPPICSLSPKFLFHACPALTVTQHRSLVPYCKLQRSSDFWSVNDSGAPSGDDLPPGPRMTPPRTPISTSLCDSDEYKETGTDKRNTRAMSQERHLLFQ